MKTFICFIFLFDFLVAEAYGQHEPLNLNNDATAFCFNNARLRHSKDLYSDPEDCHNFYQCFYLNETFAIGHRRSCPEGQYFAGALLQCVPEAFGTSCQPDPCTVDRKLECHAKTCSTYYVCTNLVSQALCCPSGTTFNQSSCSCDADEAGQCQQTCEQPVIPSTTVKPSQIMSEEFRVCIDSFGNYLQEVGGRYDHFYIFHVEPNAEITSWEDLVPIKKTEQSCSAGTFFDLQTCACTDRADTLPSTIPPAYETVLYLPLDDVEAIEDQSANSFNTFLYGSSAFYDQSVAGRGNGSARFQGDDDRLEIPGMKTFALGQEASWCLFYRCESASCNQTGGLLSNDDGSENGFSIKIVSLAGGSIEASVRFFDGAVLTVSGSASAGSFSQVCVVYQSSKLALYVDKNLVASSEIDALENRQVGLSHGPYVVGKDPVAGSFRGWIDEVFVRRSAMTESEISAHFEGGDSLEINGLVPNSEASIRRSEVVLENSDSFDVDRGLQLLRAKNSFVGLRIFHGKEAPRNKYPFACYVVLNISGTVAACGGNLIHRQFILTAAHCTAVLNTKSKVTAIIGFHDITKLDSTGVKIEIERYWQHTRYNPACYYNQNCNTNDYAILKLRTPVPLKSNIKTIHLPFNVGLCKDVPDTSNTVDSCTRATAVGWGLTETGAPSNVLRETDLDLVSRATCSKQYSRRIVDAQICAGWGLTDTCNGDSGGPLFCQMPGNTPYLIGLTSFGSANCQTEGMPGVYSRICKERVWMQGILARFGTR